MAAFSSGDMGCAGGVDGMDGGGMGGADGSLPEAWAKGGIAEPTKTAAASGTSTRRATRWNGAMRMMKLLPGDFGLTPRRPRGRLLQRYGGAGQGCNEPRLLYAAATMPARPSPAVAPGRTQSAILLTLAALALARALASALPGRWAWGLDVFRFAPWWTWGLWAASALCLLPAVGDSLD